MQYIKIILSILLLTLYIKADDSRAIYRKKYNNENKVALIIGNSSYKNFTNLKNTINDANDMRDVLETKGFDVLYLKDGDLRSMKKIVRKFSRKLSSGGIGFFYYAGHGLEVDGRNYLVPIGADIKAEDEVEFESLSVDLVIKKMENSKNRLNIIVLDACRNNPFGRGGGGGLAQINNAKGMYIAFATAPGDVASDGGGGRNGLFTKYLVENINKNNLTLNEVFKKTRVSVYRESDEKQLPWTSSSVIGDFYFWIDKTNEIKKIDTMKKADNGQMGNIVRERKIEDERVFVYDRPIVEIRKEIRVSTGLFVCYSSKFITNRNSVVYQECDRYKYSCSKNNKLHFGKYATNIQASRALKRCMGGNPRFIDSQGLK